MRTDGASDHHPNAGRPALSVVVIMFSGRAQLLHCLDALTAQAAGVDLEIILPHDERLAAPEELRQRYRGLRLLGMSGHRSPPELRAAGVAAARAPVVGLLEDHCTPAPEWCGSVLAAHRTPHAAIGGAIDKGFPPAATSDTALNWALYLIDYSRYMPPMPAGPAHGLSDCNVSYKRRALDAVADVWRDEFHENVVHAALTARGETLWFAPELVVFEHRPMDVRSAITDRYAFGRIFGGTRAHGMPLPARMVRAAMTIVMPPLLVLRVARNLADRRRYRAQFVRCLPWLVALATLWLCGEAIGYLSGSAGGAGAANRSLPGSPSVTQPHAEQLG